MHFLYFCHFIMVPSWLFVPLKIPIATATLMVALVTHYSGRLRESEWVRGEKRKREIKGWMKWWSMTHKGEERALGIYSMDTYARNGCFYIQGALSEITMRIMKGNEKKKKDKGLLYQTMLYNLLIIQDSGDFSPKFLVGQFCMTSCHHHRNRAADYYIII